MSETSKDEQELARALEGVANAGIKPAAGSSVHNGVMQPIVPPNSPVAPQPAQDNNQATAPAIGQVKVQSSTSQNNTSGSTSDGKDATLPVVPPMSPTPEPAATDTPAPADTSSEDTTASEPLDAIKNAALEELRPLVDKLDVKAEDKFDTYLLLIRSTDDMSLIAPAHEAAKAIQDEARRAQALLDIVKEIDYLSHQKNQ